MSPTLNPSDYVLITKYNHNIRTPQYFPLTYLPLPEFKSKKMSNVQKKDIIIFDHPFYFTKSQLTSKQNYIKRCIGIPNDTLIIYNYGLYLKEKIPSYISKKSIYNSKYFFETIPEKDSWIILKKSTRIFWEPILRGDGNKVIIDSNNKVFINGFLTNRYKVKQNYYFVQGDNIHFSSDSRNLGLIPQNNIIGKIVYIF